MGKTPAPYPKIVSLRVKRHAQRFSAGPQRKNVKNFRRDFDLGGLSCIKKMLENGAATVQLSPHRFRCSLTTKITNDVDHSWVIPIEWAERHFVDLAVPGICQDAADVWRCWPSTSFPLDLMNSSICCSVAIFFNKPRLPRCSILRPIVSLDNRLPRRCRVHRL